MKLLTGEVAPRSSPLIHPPIYLSIHVFIHSLIHRFIKSFIRWCTDSLTPRLTSSCIHWFTHSLADLNIWWTNTTMEIHHVWRDISLCLWPCSIPSLFHWYIASWFIHWLLRLTHWCTSKLQQFIASKLPQGVPGLVQSDSHRMVEIGCLIQSC